MSAPPPQSSRRPSENSLLAAAHARFVRAALLVYMGAAAVAIALLFTALLTNKTHNEDQSRGLLLLETDVRAQSLAQHLGLLVAEMRRLSHRSEVDLSDRDLSPEKSLLHLSHSQSTFFNLGVAILDRQGKVVGSEPDDFLDGASFGADKWFATLRLNRAMRIVPVDPERHDAALYVISPLIRDGEFSGALLGAMALDRGEQLTSRLAREGVPLPPSITVLSTHDGVVIYPPERPRFASEPSYAALFRDQTMLEPFTEMTTLEGIPSVVAVAPVSETDLVLMSITRTDELFQAAETRFRMRLGVGLVLAIAPLVLLVLLLRRSLRELRRSQEAAVREERLRMLGEAANAIAHEIKNALNGLSMGVDLIARRDERPQAGARRERVLSELRGELRRLGDFTTELMTFSKGIEPRRSALDLTRLVDKVMGIHLDTAAEVGVNIEVLTPEEPTPVNGDPTLLHLLLSNLVGNAIEAATSRGGRGQPRVEVTLDAKDEIVALRVRDTGPGVSAAMLPRLFEPFQTDKPNGIGLGLALGRKIARAHGGDLILEARRGSGDEESAFWGASFLVTLPRAQSVRKDLSEET